MDVIKYFVGYSPLLTGILLIWVAVLSVVLYRQVKLNESILGEKQPRPIKEIVLEQMGKVGELHMDVTNVTDRVDRIVESYGKSIQKVGLVRFSPFEDTGGDQSFSLALLDSKNSGIILSALHGRERTRMYAKSVVNGNSTGYALSDEEKEAITQAIGSSSVAVSK